MSLLLLFAMTPSRPYLLRALYEWINDNAMTPYILVDAGLVGVEVPVQFVQDGKIVLNIAPRAVQHLELGNETVSFHARFSGNPMRVSVPLQAVLAIYARENGRGMVFTEEDGQGEPSPEPPEPTPPPKRPSLKVVK